MVLGPLLNPDADDNENLRERFKDIPLLDSFKIIFEILQNLKREACKTLPTTAYLVNFSDITMNAFAVIQKDDLMSKIFHMILTIAPFKVLEKDDMQILKYLGFQKAVNEMTKDVPSETKKNLIEQQQQGKKNESAKQNAEPINIFPKCMILFPFLPIPAGLFLNLS